GHPGGVGTLHAGSAIGALRRLEQLIQEAVVTVPRALIAETIDLIAVLAGRGSARRLAELAVVKRLGPAGGSGLTPARGSGCCSIVLAVRSPWLRPSSSSRLRPPRPTPPAPTCPGSSR